jgi:hypothetical protein
MARAHRLRNPGNGGSSPPSDTDTASAAPRQAQRQDKPGTERPPTDTPSASNLLVGLLDWAMPGEGIPDWLDAVLPGGKTGWLPWGQKPAADQEVAPTPGTEVAPGTEVGPDPQHTTPGQETGQQTGQEPAAPEVTPNPPVEVQPEPVRIPDARCEVIDGQALMRSGPPDFKSNGAVMPLGAVVDVTEAQRGPGGDYVYIKQVLAEGAEGPALEGWTKASNLRNHKERDPDMVPTEQIPLQGLSGTELQMAVIFNTRGAYIAQQAAAYGISEADAAAVLQIESGGKAFSVQGRPITRFENHIFWSQWGREHQETFNQHFQFSREGQAWTGHRWRSDPNGEWQDFHGSQVGENQVLDFARTLDDTAALKSASYGAGQVMGFNHQLLGYDSPQTMYEAFNGGVQAQLDGMFSYFENTAALAALKRGDYTGFASSYNGSGQAEHYGELIRAASQAFSRVRPLATAP